MTCAYNRADIPSSGWAATANISAGASQERSALERGAVPLAVPLIPTGISAAGGNGSVTMRWMPSAGATSYNIYYATSSSVSKKSGLKVADLKGSPYTVRPLKNKNPYYFVVTAVNAGGESGDSPWVMATPLAKAPEPGLVRIPAGRFRMGDNLDRTGHSLPVHTVDLDEFSIDRYETMYALWKEVYDWALPAATNSTTPDSTALRQGHNLPVVLVNWYDAVKWL
jgi:formylglycine-generating enzyme required for sulfatase activity